MSRIQPLSTLRALLFAGAALIMAATAMPASASEVNQSFPEPATIDNSHAQPVTECTGDQLSCGENLCCEAGDECCMPPNDVAYCAKIC